MKGRYVFLLFFLMFESAWAFNPIMPYNLVDNVYSFRSLSTGFMFSGYIDYVQNPLLLPSAEENAIFTGLSNLNASEFLFNNVSDNDIKVGGIYHSGIGSEGVIFVFKNQRIPDANPLGRTGEVTIDSTVYSDRDGDGYPDIKKLTHLYSNAWHNNTGIRFALSFYLDREEYGLGFFFSHLESTQKTVAGGDTLHPYGEFVFTEKMFNNSNGFLISTVYGVGDGAANRGFNSSLGAIGANFRIGEWPAGILIVYRDEHSSLNENYTSSVLRDNAPLEPFNPHFIDDYYERSNNDEVYFKRLSLSAITPDSELDVVYALNAGVLMHSGKVGVLFNRNMRIQKDRLSDSIRVQLNRQTTITSFSEPEGMGYDGYFTLIKGLSLGDRGKMRIGFSFYGVKDRIKRHVVKIDTVYTEYRDGDVQTDDYDDYDDLAYSKVEYDSTLERVGINVSVPCGFVYKVHKNVEIRLGVVEQILWEKSQDYTVITDKIPYTHEVIRGDGTHTLTTRNLVFENSNIVNETITPVTNFYYGAGFKLGKYLTIDLMNFSQLFNLNNWQVSVVFRF